MKARTTIRLGDKLAEAPVIDRFTSAGHEWAITPMDQGQQESEVTFLDDMFIVTHIATGAAVRQSAGPHPRKVRENFRQWLTTVTDAELERMLDSIGELPERERRTCPRCGGLSTIP